MGSEAFEATGESESVRTTREGMALYRGLVKAGMERLAAVALVETLYNERPGTVTMTFVEHTGVFGLWDDSTEMWFAGDRGVIHGPKCVMLAHLRMYHTINADHDDPSVSIREFAADGQPILDDESKEGE